MAHPTTGGMPRAYHRAVASATRSPRSSPSSTASPRAVNHRHMVATSRLEELEASRVADDVHDLRPVDDDETLTVEQHVVRREVAVRPAAPGQRRHGRAHLLEELTEQVAWRPRLGQPGCGHPVGADELHEHLAVAQLHRIGDRQPELPQRAERLELCRGPLPRQQLAAVLGAPGHGPHLAAAAHPAALVVAGVAMEHPVLAGAVALRREQAVARGRRGAVGHPAPHRRGRRPPCPS